MENGSSGEIPSNANEHCPGPQSESAGKSDSCDGCPNQQICATAPKGADPDSSFMSHSTPTSIASNAKSMSDAPKLKRNSADIGWDYAILTSATNQERWKCLKCDKEFSGGVSRIKQHIAGIRGNIASCTKSTDEDKKKCKDAIQKAKKKLGAKQGDANIRREVHVINNEHDDGCSKKSSRSLGPMDEYVSKINHDDICLNESKGKRQQSINDALYKERNLHVSQHMARWVYESGIPFNAVDNDAFRKFVEAVGHFGPGYQPPSQYRLREPLLKDEVKIMKKSLKDQEKVRSGRHVEEVRVCNEDDFVSDDTDDEEDADEEFEFESDKDIEVKDDENEEMRE